MNDGWSGLEIPAPDHIEYIRQDARAAINSTVSLSCGSSMPTLFIWVFSKTESESNEALAYNYGLSPKTLPLANTLGEPFLAANTSNLIIRRIQAEAEGFYTCQALYDTDKGPRVTFYYINLSLQTTTKGSSSVWEISHVKRTVSIMRLFTMHCVSISFWCSTNVTC